MGLQYSAIFGQNWNRGPRRNQLAGFQESIRDSEPNTVNTGSWKYRWLLCLLLFLVTVNNYMDRQLFSIVAPVITTEFKLSASQIALIINSFLLAYGIGQVFSGRFMDWA